MGHHQGDDSEGKKGGRKRTIDVRQIINAIFYATDNGVKWRSLPKEYPHWGDRVWLFQTMDR